MKSLLYLVLLLSGSLLSRAATAPSEHWPAPGGEFSVQFSGRPEVSEVDARPTEGAAHLDIAHYVYPDLIEHAEASQNQRTKPITSEEAMQLGASWAKFTGVSNPKMTFDGFHPEDRKLTIKGSWKVEGRPMTITAVMHWGKKIFLLVYASEPSVTPETARFLGSVKQSFQASLSTGK